MDERSGRREKAIQHVVLKGGDMSVIGETIRNLRERMGATQDRLAEWAGVSRAIITQVEAGRREPESLELFRIADFFGCTVSDLLRVEPEDLDTAGVRFRRALNMDDTAEIDEAVSRSIRIAREAANLREILGADASDSVVPRYMLHGPTSKGEAIRQGNRTAVLERARLGLGTDRIESIAELVESQGVCAGDLALPSDVFGITINMGSLGAVCFVDKGQPALRKRFSLAHEYGHVLMDSHLPSVVSRGREREDLAEVRANAFAAAFLMPEDGCLEMVRKIGKGAPSRERTQLYDEEEVTCVEERNIASEQDLTLIDAARLAHYFGASMQSMLYRLRNIGLINQARLIELIKQEAGETGAGLRCLMQHNGSKVCFEEPDLFRNTLVNMALEALRRDRIGRGKCLQIGRLVCSGEQMEAFEDLVCETSPEPVPVLVPGEDQPRDS